MKYISLSVFLIWTLVGCKTVQQVTQPESINPVKGNTYTLVDGGNMVSNDKGNAINLTFTGKEFSGFSGCNRVNGEYSILNERFVTSGVMTTRMSCGEGNDKLEFNFLQLLNQVDRFKMENNNLNLYKDQALLLQFKPNTSAQ